MGGIISPAGKLNRGYFFTFALLFFCASEILLRAAADIVLFAFT
jgi:hypothetical protein